MKTILALVMLVGCAGDDAPIDPGVVACRRAAARTCETIGYGENATCLLAFAAGCSPEDEAAAHAACAVAAGTPTSAECSLHWR